MLFQAGHAVSRAEKQFVFFFKKRKKHMFLKLKSMSRNDSQGGIHFALHAEHDIK